MKAREFVRKILAPIGAVLVRKDGDHHIYRLPNGRTFLVPMGGSQNEASSYLLFRLRRLMQDTISPNKASPEA